MQRVEVVFGLFAVIAVVVTVARRTPIPYPILLVVVGLGIALVPGLPRIELDPELALLLFLPPLLYWAALHTSVRDVRENVRSISLLAVALVLLTMAAVALLAHAVIGLPWAVAAVLGAVVSPPDPVAAVAVAERLGLPRRLVTILEGEGLLNDATALVAYRLAVAAAVTGSFSAPAVGARFLLAGVGGAAVGLAAAWAGRQALRRLSDPPVENTVNLLIPFAAWIGAERFGASGVLAVLACGLAMSRRGVDSISSAARLQARGVWDMLVFILNSLSFILIGIQLRTVLAALRGRPLSQLLVDAALVNAVVVGVRLLWVYPASWLPRRLSAAVRDRDPFPGWGETTVLAWAGMRGVVSLAAALAIPRVLRGGGAFPERDLVVFLSFSVIVVTLVGQGLTLPALIAALGVGEPGDRAAREEARALARTAEVALARLEELEARSEEVPAQLVERLRERYRMRLASQQETDEGAVGARERHADAYRWLAGQLISAQRDALRRLSDEEGLSPAVVQKLRHDLDVEESQLGQLG